MFSRAEFSLLPTPAESGLEKVESESWHAPRGDLQAPQLAPRPSPLRPQRLHGPALVSGALPSLAFNGDTLGVLPAISAASSVTSIADLDCAFFAYNRYVLPKEIFDAARALNALVTRLSHLGHLHFNPYVAGHSTKELFGWSNAVAAFLNSAVERSDCAITVYSGLRDDYVADPRPFSHVFRGVQAQSRASIAQRLRKAFGSLFRFPRRVLTSSSTEQHDIESTERPSSVTLPLPAKPRLTTFNIHASLLFHANFFRWTIHTLNTAPLTSLSLTNIDLSHYDWALILPRLSLPALSRLAIGQCAITVPDLDAFLLRHAKIEVLDLAGHGVIGALVPPLSESAAEGTTPETFLPRLTTLTASPEYLLYLLSPPPSSESKSPPEPSPYPPPYYSPYPAPAPLPVPPPSAWFPRLHTLTAASNDDSAYQAAQLARVVAGRLAYRVDSTAADGYTPTHLGLYEIE
ncbi:hypothetical protein B0H12DRAFT_1277879 [Mycena haematopus]|nr:hypothetical protein B0H12DRAFT_1277879 [Mycena haematopus]